MPRSVSNSSTDGFTLTELLITLGVVGVIAAFAAPAFGRFIAEQRIRGAADTLFANLVLTRSEAIKRNDRASLCVSRDGERCDNTGNWDQGWILYADANGNGQREQVEPLIQRQGPFARLRIKGNTPVVRNVNYDRDGRTRRVSGAFQAGTIAVCADDPSITGRAIVVSASGRPRTEATSCAR